MFEELSIQEREKIVGGCAWCYVGAAAAVAGGYLTGGPLGAIVAGVGVVGVILN